MTFYIFLRPWIRIPNPDRDPKHWRKGKGYQERYILKQAVILVKHTGNQYFVWFSCVPTGWKAGMVEFVEDAKTFREIQVRILLDIHLFRAVISWEPDPLVDYDAQLSKYVPCIISKQLFCRRHFEIVALLPPFWNCCVFFSFCYL